jgi:hypothetical protein
MPTSDCASAGASLTPSPTIATTRPAACSVLHGGSLVARQHLGLDLLRRVQPDLAGNRLRRAPVVAGQHHHAQVLLCIWRIAAALSP